MEMEHKRRMLVRRGLECERCGTLHLIKSVEPNSQPEHVSCRCRDTITFDPDRLDWYEVSEQAFEQGFALSGEWRKKKGG
jgi:hypothetical protein